MKVPLDLKHQLRLLHHSKGGSSWESSAPVPNLDHGSMLPKPSTSPREVPQGIVTHPDVASVTLGASLVGWEWPCRGCRC